MVGVYIECEDLKLKKTSLEAMTYARNLAQASGTELIGFIFSAKNEELSTEIGQYGVNKICYLKNSVAGTLDNQIQARILAQQIANAGLKQIVFSATSHGKPLAARTAVRCNLNAPSNTFSVINNPTELITENNFTRSVYSGKAFENVVSQSERKIIILSPNSYSSNTFPVTPTIEEIELTEKSSSTTLINKIKTSDQVSLTEANIVVSGGRGLKGPENWGMVLELAQLLKAATACSRPVADMHWRPHHEHVGQTGIQINPTLYIAIGISGAIQHLAGVNRSKYILVINNDPDAPFIKAADFAIIGDCFSVVPKLISAINNLS